jgi:hypothetical protein
MEAVLIKQPTEISFSGNPMPYIFGITPYGTIEKTQDIRLVVRVLVESVFGNNSFAEIKAQPFYPDSNGQVKIEIQTLIDPFLEYHTPKLSLKRPVQAFNQRKRYRVQYTLQKDGAIVGEVQSSPVLFAIKGGMSYDQWHPSQFFNKNILEDKSPLHFVAAGDKCHVAEKKYLFWIYPFADNKVQTVMIDIMLDDNSVIQYNLPYTIFCGKWGICCVPIGFNQLGLNTLVQAGQWPVYYRVKVMNAANIAIVAPVIYNIDHRNFYDTYQLLYRNSLGGIDTIRLRGTVDFEADYTRQNAQRTVPPSYYSNGNLLAQSIDENAEETTKFKGDTGFLSKASIDKLRDLFLSSQKMELENEKLLPITINNKNVKFFSNKENLLSLQIEWQRAYVNEFYTPVNTITLNASCPAVENFIVKQINKNLLQIMYALQTPYDRIEVQVITSEGTETFYYTGNAQTIKQKFENPIDIGTEEITIKARTLCDEEAVPPNIGPWTTILLVINGNSLPIANDDVYNIAAGYNSDIILAGSVLANDYDPDGDIIEVIAAAGATVAGGTYSITSAGIITYAPPNSDYIGADSFTYEIQEFGGGTPVQATVTINVGQLSGNIFAKIVYRNEQSSGNQYATSSQAEIWMDFFNDPGGITPLDVTGMGVTFNYREDTSEQDTNGIVTGNQTDTPVLGTGTKMKLLDAIVSADNYDPGFLHPYIFTAVYSMLPGTGYIPI